MASEERWCEIAVLIIDFLNEACDFGVPGTSSMEFT